MTLPVYIRWEAGKLPIPAPTVHILRGGLAGGVPLCSPETALPENGGRWPAGHQWIAENHPECDALANCPECVRRRRSARP